MSYSCVFFSFQTNEKKRKKEEEKKREAEYNFKEEQRIKKEMKNMEYQLEKYNNSYNFVLSVKK